MSQPAFARERAPASHFKSKLLFWFQVRGLIP